MSTSGTNRRPARDYLAIYLNDHLAGSTTGVALAKRAVGHARSTETRGVLERLAGEIEEDRETLLAIMRELGARPDVLKVAGGALVERLGRLKPNGHLFGASPLTPLIELEGLSLGVEGKLELWRAVEHVLGAGNRLSKRLEVLIDRGETQREKLMQLRLAAAAEALADEADRKARHDS
jgi:hypothetical protein